MQYLISILVFAVMLLVLVLIHEAGHFFAAKFFGVKVEEFGFGLPPRLWGKKIGETIYSLNWIPAGGFVRLWGEDEDQLEELKDKKRSFAHQPPYKRAIISLAGVVMNFLLAFVIFSIVYFMGAPTYVDRVAKVSLNSPAAQAGLKEGDIITRINGHLIASPDDLHDQVYRSLGKKMTFTVKRGEGLSELTVTPRVNPPKDEGAIGVALEVGVQKVKFPLWEAPIVGIDQSISLTRQTIQVLGSAVGDLVTKQKAPEQLGGGARIVYFTHESIKAGWEYVLLLAGSLSLNLAILNVLPLPALDGGRLFFIIIEAFTRRKVSPTFEKWVHTTGFAFLMILIVLVTLNDFSWLLSNTAIGGNITKFLFHK